MTLSMSENLLQPKSNIVSDGHMEISKITAESGTI